MCISINPVESVLLFKTYYFHHLIGIKTNMTDWQRNKRNFIRILFMPNKDFRFNSFQHKYCYQMYTFWVRKIPSNELKIIHFDIRLEKYNIVQNKLHKRFCYNSHDNFYRFEGFSTVYHAYVRFIRYLLQVKHKQTTFKEGIAISLNSQT